MTMIKQSRYCKILLFSGSGSRLLFLALVPSALSSFSFQCIKTIQHVSVSIESLGEFLERSGDEYCGGGFAGGVRGRWQQL